MSQHDSDICVAFVNNQPVKKGWLTRVSKGGGSKNGPWANSGTLRLSVEGDELRSYGTWPVAVRLASGVIILNADKSPSKTTGDHQRDARDACKLRAVERALLPFSALRAAGINPREIKIIHVTEDKFTDVQKTRPDGSTYFSRDHFLGETLFEYQRRFYVSGLDRNDEPKMRKFYLAKIPDSGLAPSSVEEALDMLRPAGLPVDTLRQGEWFLVPTDRRITKDIVKTHQSGWGNGPVTKGVPIVSDDADVMRKALKDPFRDRSGRHCASRMHLGLDGNVYVSGVLRDAEHGPLKLGEGWFRVVRNLADGSWAATGDVD